MKKNVKLYNVVFPVWLLIIFPISWLLVVPANFVVDSLVIFIGLYILRIGRKKEFYKRTILWVFLFGFIADLIGSGVLLLTQFIFTEGRGYEYIGAPVAENPFDNIYSLLYVILAIVVSGVLIYVFNRFISFKVVIDKKIKRFMALILAVLTAPYMFLLPTSTFYGGTSENFTNHIVYSGYIELELYMNIDGNETDVNKDENGKQKDYALSTSLADGINTAKKTKKELDGTSKYKAVFSTSRKNGEKLDEIPIWEIDGVLYFRWKDKSYEIKGEYSEKVLKEIDTIKAG